MTETRTSQQASNEDSAISIENIEILDRIGEGAAGTVYRGYHKAMEVPVAIKVLKRSKTASAKQDTTSFLRFRNEARLANQLSHANIVRVLSFGMLPDQQPYIVMELLPGKSLRTILQRDRMLTVELALEIFKQLCSGMENAHAHQIVHRDLKPDNVIVSFENGAVRSVKITDFGIAKMTANAEETEQQRLTRTGAILGTPMFMSPEHFNSADPDARSDIYSLGCILYQMLCGKPPFAGESTYELMQKHFDETPALPSKVRTIPRQYEPLDYIINKCLAKQPADRYQSCSEILADIAAMETRSFSPQKKLSGTVHKKDKKSSTQKTHERLILPALVVVALMGMLLISNQLKKTALPVPARTALWQQAQRDFDHKDFGRAQRELDEFLEQTTKGWKDPKNRVPDNYDPALDVPRVVQAAEYADLCSKNWTRWEKQPWYDTANFLIMVSEQQLAGKQISPDIRDRLQKKIESIKNETDVKTNDLPDFRKHLQLAADLEMASAAITYYYYHRPDEALKFLQQGDDLIAYSQKLGRTDTNVRIPTMRADILQNVGVYELDSGNYDQASELFHQAIEGYKNASVKHLTPSAYGLLGCAQYFSGHRAEALDSFAHCTLMTKKSSAADKSAAGWNRLRLWLITLPMKAYAHLNDGDQSGAERICAQMDFVQMNNGPNIAMSTLGLRGLIDEKNHRTNAAKDKYKQATEQLEQLLLSPEQKAPLSSLETVIPLYCADRYIAMLELENPQSAAKTREDLDRAIKTRPQLWDCVQRFKKQM